MGKRVNRVFSFYAKNEVCDYHHKWNNYNHMIIFIINIISYEYKWPWKFWLLVLLHLAMNKVQSWYKSAGGGTVGCKVFFMVKMMFCIYFNIKMMGGLLSELALSLVKHFEQFYFVWLSIANHLMITYCLCAIILFSLKPLNIFSIKYTPVQKCTQVWLHVVTSHNLITTIAMLLYSNRMHYPEIMQPGT